MGRYRISTTSHSVAIWLGVVTMALSLGGCFGSSRDPALTGEEQATTETAPAAAAGVSSQLLFQSNRDGDSEIYLLDTSSGAGPSNISFAFGDDSQARFSADGNAVVYVGADFDNGDTQLLLLDENGVTPLTTAVGDDAQPQFCSDGIRIVFVSNRSGSIQLHLLSLADNSITQLTSLTDDSAADPQFSPDCSLVFYTRFANNAPFAGEIWRLPTAGGAELNLSNNAASDFAPIPAPDGSFVAFISERDGQPDIFRMNTNGSAISNLTNNIGSFDLEPSISPDSKNIVFRSERTGDSEIFTMSASGLNPSNISNTMAAFDQQPHWAPDGNQIAYSSNRNGDFDIVVHNLSTATDSVVTVSVGDDQAPRWRPFAEE